MLVVVDYGAGNLRSVLHALNYLGVEGIRVARGKDDLHGAKKIILPGVGAFGAGMQKLHEQNLVQPICDAVRGGTPYLGICLGMQFLFECSDEMGDHEGLNLLPGRVTRFPSQTELKIPHMGWNQFTQYKPSPLLRNVAPESYAYFVHSYYCVPTNPEDIVATVDYGVRFTAIVQHENIFGVQFHPEKSQRTGLQILSNFLEMTA
jgi:glutamine amidotransferase